MFEKEKVAQRSGMHAVVFWEKQIRKRWDDVKISLLVNVRPEFGTRPIQKIAVEVEGIIMWFSIYSSLLQSSRLVLVWSWVQVGVVEGRRGTVSEVFKLGAAWTKTTRMPRRLVSARWRNFIVAIS